MFRKSSGGAAGRIVEFCLFAREQGLSGGVEETLGALQAVASLGVRSWADLKAGLRAVLCSSKEEWDRFEAIFQAFWTDRGPQSSPSRPPRRDHEGATGEQSQKGGSLMSGAVPGDPSPGEGNQAVAGASLTERLRKADVSTLGEDDLATLEQISVRLLAQMSRRISRRRRVANGKGRVDLRRTIRTSISRGGDPIELRYQDPKPRPPRLVMLLDISGSMSPYSLFLVRFVYALQRHFRRVDTFLFSTELVEVTKVLHARRLPDAFDALSQLAAGWSGGTKIGGSLRDFNLHHSRKLRSGETLFMILSDGWDTGEPEALAAELAAIKRRVRTLIWLNPLLGLADYQPITRGMSAALPHVDVFAPAHNLESLLELEQHL